MPVSSQTVMPCVSFFQSGTGTHGIPCRASPPLFLPGSLHNGRSLAVLHLPASCVSPSLPLWSGKGTVPDGTSPAPALPKEFPYRIFYTGSLPVGIPQNFICAALSSISFTNALSLFSPFTYLRNSLITSVFKSIIP